LSTVTFAFWFFYFQNLTFKFLPQCVQGLVP
jgi:hypothetical protein